MNNLDPRIEQGLRAALEAVARRGELLSRDSLERSYAIFRDRFGPDRLKSLDGEALLETMHAHGNKESLVYWLEFKNDEEFPTQRFGGIGGGAAHKFGLFRRKDTGQWVKGSAQKEENISQVEAVTIARRHRDQLLACVALLEELPADADDSRYQRLQEQVSQGATDIGSRGWAHKYLSLLFPNKLDDYHNQDYQRFHLIKVLQLPPEGEGLYLAAGRFVSLAKHFGWPPNHLDTALNERNGRPVHYWRIGTRVGEGAHRSQGEFIWPAMQDGGYAAIGWPVLGDLSKLGDMDDDLKEPIRERLHRPLEASMAHRASSGREEESP
jgi:5-methylcytosine-specific restriction protein B